MRERKLLPSILLASLALAPALGPAYAQESPLHKLGDDRIRQAMIRDSLARHRGACACPWQTDRRGRRCDGRAAYAPAHPGRPPFCYATDITDAMVQDWRERHHVRPPVP
ncbi:MAG: hypothetical protein JO209_00600 [Acidisphaera sp.]|nr:hypothetical protein [Acidisphaera sp.]